MNWSDIQDIAECLFGKYDNFNLLEQTSYKSAHDFPKNTLFFCIFSFQRNSTNVKLALTISFTYLHFSIMEIANLVGQRD